MNILLTRSISGPRDQDYLSDCTLHGLRALFGNTVVDSPRQDYMYKEEFGTGKRNLQELYGRGFTIFATLPEDDDIDRTDIEHKIKSNFFDLIFISGVARGTPYFREIFENYSTDKIIILDGEDYAHITTLNGNLGYNVNKGTLFKRELIYEDSHIYPISFSFPKEKIQKLNNKSRVLSNNLPNWDMSNGIRDYIHELESTYYADYNESLFGKTSKKGGWDCMRHYEILGCRAIPWFVDIKECPSRICTTLPKHLFIEVLNLIDQHGMDWFSHAGWDRYLELENNIHQHFLKYCTTEETTKYILDTHKKHVG
jgi:hypothetical protein